MKAEKIVLSQLIIKNQTETFKENKISALVYNIRDKKYNCKLSKVQLISFKTDNIPIVYPKAS